MDALAEGVLMSEWEPIETAPEGVRVLVCGSKRLDGPVVAHKANGEWLIETCSSHENIYPPKYWMALPAPPEGFVPWHKR